MNNVQFRISNIIIISSFALLIILKIIFGYLKNRQ